MIGTKLGPYELVEEVGHGGMATVFRAFQPNVDRFVAVKVIHRSVSLDSKALDRFTREARLVARLEHPHILPVYDYNGLNDPPYIVMRYLPTGTLKDILERDQLPYEEVAYLLTQISSALDYAHRQGVVHRDIKPSNIMVDGEGNAFLTDFGIARMVEGGEGLTGSGMAIGTPGYMSPEQGLGMPIDGRADIYSLGVMVYEMLVGAVPYSAETPMAVILKHINDPVPEITLANPRLPSPVNQVVMKAMAKSPDDRYATATEMARALTSALGTTHDMTPVRLQAVAAQTIIELEKERAELAKNAPPTIPSATNAVSGATNADSNLSPISGTRELPRPVMQGAFAGIGVFILLALLVGGVILFVGNTNSSNATATFVAGAQTDIAHRTEIALAATLTATFRPSETSTPTNLPDTPTATASPTTPPTATTAPTETPVPTIQPTVPPTAVPTTEPTVAPTSPPPTEVALVPSPVPQVDPQVVLTSGKLPYLNDMEAPSALNNWDFDSSVWKLQADSGNVALVGTGTYQNVAVILPGKSPDWSSETATNMLISLDMNLDTVSSIGRVIFRHSSAGYYLMELGVGRVVIKRGKTGDFTKVGEERIVAQVTNTTIRNGNWYNIEIWSDVNRVYVYVNHRRVLSAEDIGDTLGGGTMMLQSYNKNFRVRFDNYKVQRPLDASQHFETSQWPATWQRSSESSIKVVADAKGNNFVDVAAGEIAPINPPINDLRMSCRIWSVEGGFDLRLRESKGGAYLLKFVAGELNVSKVDATGKSTPIQRFTSFYGHGDYIDLTVETIGDQLRIFTPRTEFTQTIKAPPSAGNMRITANEGDKFRVDDCLFVETALSSTEDATWAFNKIAQIEARNPAQLLTEWYDMFDDKFRTKDWWDGGVNAPGDWKVNAADKAHPNYLEMTYREAAPWRIFRYVPEFFVFGVGTDPRTFFDSSDIYLKVDVRVPNAGTAWIAARTALSIGKSSLNGYRIELTRNEDGSYSVAAKGYTLEAQPVYFSGELPTITGEEAPDWVRLLIVCYQNKIAFFANGRYIGSTNNASLLGGTIALGVEPGTVANFDDLEMRDVSPETR